jgi:hypothetical protein
MFEDHADAFSLHSLVIASPSLRWSIMTLYTHQNWRIPLMNDVKMHSTAKGLMSPMSDVTLSLNFT